MILPYILLTAIYCLMKLVFTILKPVQLSFLISLIKRKE
nr:MAG TPA: hypothetical protein [Caudoviricetes sp.]